MRRRGINHLRLFSRELGGRPVGKRIAQLREAMNESHMGHLSRLSLILFLLLVSVFNDREMNVIVDINVFYSDS
jgi:hypothetical protein